MNSWMKKKQEPQPFYRRARWSLKEDFDLEKMKRNKCKHKTSDKVTKSWLYRYTLEQENHLIERPIYLKERKSLFLSIALKHNCCPSDVRLYRYKKEKRPYNVSNYEFTEMSNPYCR